MMDDSGDEAGAAAALILRMASGDEEALGELYVRFGQPVYAAVIRILGDTGAAEDVVEETFWQAWRTAADYRAERGAVGTWLMMIARSRAHDRLRARRRRSGGFAAQPEQPASAEQPPVAEPHRKLAAALETLPDDQREAIELAFFDGLTHQEIAERTGTPLGTVKSRLRRALLALRQQVNMRREPRQ